MRVFITGASGFIGSAVVPELLSKGHHVVGLARSDASSAKLTAAGAEVQRGDLEDLDVLRKSATSADAVIHLGFIHDFANFARSIEVDQRAVEVLGGALQGSDKPLSIASGLLGMSLGRAATEKDFPDASLSPRIATAQNTLDLAKKGVRSSVVRLAPTVHGPGDHGFIHALVNIAREKGFAGYVEDGANRWPALHVRDAGSLFRLAIEKSAPGAVLHGTAEEGISTRQIAEVIGRHLKVPARSVPRDKVADHFGWIGHFFGMDSVASSEITRKSLGWEPTHPGLIADLDLGHYFDEKKA